MRPAMSSARRIALTALAFGAIAVTARADASDKRVSAYFSSPEMRESIASAVKQSIAEMPLGCDDVEISANSEFNVLDPLEFEAGAATPTRGMWVESLDVVSCGAKRRHNVQALVNDGKIDMFIRLNGASIANVVLQRDVLQLLPGAAAQVVGDCAKWTVLDSSFDGFEGEPIKNAKDGPSARVWRETWTYWACGKEYSVPIVFTPDADGTTFAIKASEIKAR